MVIAMPRAKPIFNHKPSKMIDMTVLAMAEYKPQASPTKMLGIIAKGDNKTLTVKRAVTSPAITFRNRKSYGIGAPIRA
jgi:hypothetical protein